jgi:hypothetical protein
MPDSNTPEHLTAVEVIALVVGLELVITRCYIA